MTEVSAVQEKWKVLEVQLGEMACLQRHRYKYLGMNYSIDPTNERLRFEYIFRNAQTVWVSFSFYPKSKKRPDLMQVKLVSPFRQDELMLSDWVKQCSYRLDVANFSQFPGEFEAQAHLLLALINKTLSHPGLEALLAGYSGIDIPSLSLPA